MIARSPRRIWQVSFAAETLHVIARTAGHAARLASRIAGVQLFTEPETRGFRTIVQNKPRIWAGVEVQPGLPCPPL